jgi:hypothetical protein
MANSLKLRPEKVTQEMFDRLPALLTAYQAKLITGLDDHELAGEVKAGRIETWQRPKPRVGCKRSYSKYTKASVGKIAGFKN